MFVDLWGMANEDRFVRDWGTPEQVEAAWRAGWDIDQGPPPAGPDAHALPPEHTVVGQGPHGEFRHNGIEPTDALPLFNADGSPNEVLLQALAQEDGNG